jgi:molecular chaperone GrpE
MADDEAREAAPEALDEALRDEEAARSELGTLQDRLHRALADLDNARKRHAREAERIRAAERAQVAGVWLPVLDNLELALAHAQSDPDAIIEGIRAVHEQALTVLDRLGFPRRDDEGAAFDPARHEAVSSVADDTVAPGTIVHVVRPGYGDDEQLLRPASVVVASKGT